MKWVKWGYPKLKKHLSCNREQMFACFVVEHLTAEWQAEGHRPVSFIEYPQHCEQHPGGCKGDWVPTSWLSPRGELAIVTRPHGAVSLRFGLFWFFLTNSSSISLMELFSFSEMRGTLAQFLFNNTKEESVTPRSLRLIERSHADSQLHTPGWAHHQVYAGLYASPRPLYFWTGQRDAVKEADHAWRSIFGD